MTKTKAEFCCNREFEPGTYKFTDVCTDCGYYCTSHNYPMTKTKPMTDEWQTIFLNAGTEKGLGDLSMMIGVVSEIIAQATSKAREEERLKHCACEFNKNNLSDLSGMCKYHAKLIEAALTVKYKSLIQKDKKSGNWVGEYSTRDPNNPFPLNLSITKKDK